MPLKNQHSFSKTNISSALCFPIRRALLRLAPGSALPALQRERQLRSSVFTNQTDNLNLTCFSRKSKNYSFSDSRLVCLQIPEPNCNFRVSCLLPTYYARLCLSRLHQHLSAFFVKYFKHMMLPHPQSVAKTVAPGSTLPALQRECHLRSSAFTNQTDNLSLRWCSRKSKNYSFSRLVRLHCCGR